MCGCSIDMVREERKEKGWTKRKEKGTMWDDYMSYTETSLSTICWYLQAAFCTTLEPPVQIKMSMPKKIHTCLRNTWQRRSRWLNSVPLSFIVSDRDFIASQFDS